MAENEGGHKGKVGGEDGRGKRTRRTKREKGKREGRKEARSRKVDEWTWLIRTTERHIYGVVGLYGVAK